MASLRGFGFTVDLTTGLSRQWYVGSDGIKRWVDNGLPVAATLTAPGADK